MVLMFLRWSTSAEVLLSVVQTPFCLVLIAPPSMRATQKLHKKTGCILVAPLLSPCLHEVVYFEKMRRQTTSRMSASPHFSGKKSLGSLTTDVVRSTQRNKRIIWKSAKLYKEVPLPRIQIANYRYLQSLCIFECS